MGGQARQAPWFPVSVALTERGSQEVGLSAKSGRSRSTRIWRIRSEPRRRSEERVGDGGDLSGSRVNMDCGPDRDIAQIVWSRDGWDDGQEAERRAFVWAGQIYVSRQVERMGAGAGAGSDCADPTCGAEWCGQLGEARIGRVRELGDVRLRAVGDAPEGGREALRRSDRKPRDVLVAVGAGQIDGEGGVRSRRVGGRRSLEVRIERAPFTRARPAVRPFVDGEELTRSLFGERGVPRHPFALHFIGAAVGRRDEWGQLPAEDMEVESFKGGLR